METHWPELVLVILLALALLGWWRASTRMSRGNRRRQRRAVVGESEAERLLERYGFTIEERQVSTRWTMHVDGEPIDVLSRADLVVSRWSQVFVAEVKTGDNAPNPTRPATRRQLMEYLHAFEVDGVLLVDMEARSVHEVSF